MDKEKIQNPPAFPIFGKNPQDGSMFTQLGMSLRDYFARGAMQAYNSNRDTNYEEVAQWAYDQADAMLKQRTK